jgi:hypothetical protein
MFTSANSPSKALAERAFKEKVHDIFIWPFLTNNAVIELHIKILFHHHVFSVEPVIKHEPSKKILSWNIARLPNIQDWFRSMVLTN